MCEMSLFTEKERADLCYMHDNDPEKLFDATVAAVLEKLAAGVSVEPVGVVIGFDDDTGNAVVDHSCEGPYGPLDDYEGIYNLDQLNTAIAAARVQENERCAKLIEDEEEDGLPLETLANGIRSSLGNSVSFETCYSPTPARREE